MTGAGRTSAALAALVAMASPPAPAGPAATLALVTEDAPPLSQSGPGGAVTGRSTEILARAFEAAGIRYTTALFPWARAYNMALTQASTCVYSTARLPQREPLFKWVGPIGFSTWALFGRDGAPSLSSLDEARAGRIGGYRSDGATAFLEEKGFAVEESTDDRLNLRKLRNRRFDYWVNSLEVGYSRIREAGVTDVRPVLVIQRAPLYLACNMSVPDPVIESINRALALTLSQP